MSVTNSRHQVLAFLIRTRTASVREISRALKMSAANVRHHLRVLVSDGRVELTAVREREGRGRP
jgi:predicted ArsR family transcriptional regulator